MNGLNVKLKRATKNLLRALLVCVGSVAIYGLYLVAADNFHVVSPGRVYRSSQMNGRTLTRVISEYGIKSILNLRGENGGSDWYLAETNAAGRMGVEHFDFRLSARRELTEEGMEQILSIMRVAPKPLLIHCKSGADRTGLVSALYCLAIEGQTPRQADKQLTIWYGHVPFLPIKERAMDRSFWRYVSNHSAQTELKLQPKSDSP